MKGFGKRFFSVFLALVMVVGLMPTSALAAESTYEVGDTQTTTTATAPEAESGTVWDSVGEPNKVVDLTKCPGTLVSVNSNHV